MKNHTAHSDRLSKMYQLKLNSTEETLRKWKREKEQSDTQSAMHKQKLNETENEKEYYKRQVENITEKTV